MSVIDLGRDQPGLDFLQEQVRRGVECFFCHRPLTSPSIYWMGASADILVHPSCCLELIVRLARDIHEVECSQRLYLTTRTTSDLRRRLMAEEGAT